MQVNKNIQIHIAVLFIYYIQNQKVLSFQIAFGLSFIKLAQPQINIQKDTLRPHVSTTISIHAIYQNSFQWSNIFHVFLFKV